MKYYRVKVDLWGIKAGSIERFADHKAAPLLMAGSIEPYVEPKPTAPLKGGR